MKAWQPNSTVSLKLSFCSVFTEMILQSAVAEDKCVTQILLS